MADKFIPFNPETAKNGDTVYGVLTDSEYYYVGKHPNNLVLCVTYHKTDKKFGWEYPYNLAVKAPKKTVWVNVYSQGVACYWYGTEGVANSSVNRDSGAYIGTYPLEIDDVA